MFRGVSRTKTGQFLTVSAMLFALAGGAALGIGSYTFVYARGASYMFSDPEICANCHIMQGHYDAWTKGSHHKAAVCNDCHTPHNFFGKWLVKGINGFNHSMAFTTGWFHEPIQITPLNRRVTESACRYCHADIVDAIDMHASTKNPLECIRCHESVGHME